MEKVWNTIKMGTLLALTFFLLACSETEFSEKEATLESYNVRVGQVDILFVVDNSGSMSEEHRRMARSFPNFVQGLDLAGLDYRIGIITTDVESRVNPLVDYGQGRGALQNGNLIEFSDGNFYLTPDSLQVEDQFAEAIERRETLECERSGYRVDVCPSDDERGIYAAYLTVANNKRDFFRKNGHAAFIFLTDEDVRGQGLSNHEFRLPEPLDYPANLVKAVRENLGENMDMSAHAIITNNSSCLALQKAQGGNQNIHGVIGDFYKRLTEPNKASLIDGSQTLADFAGGQLVPGVVGSICSNDYVEELGRITDVLVKTKASEKLRCPLFNDENLVVRVDQNFDWTLSDSKDEILFTPPLPAGESFKLEYECF